MNKVRKFSRSPNAAPVSEARDERALALVAELRGLADSLERQAAGAVDLAAYNLVGYARTVATARTELDRAIGTSWLTDPALELLLSAFVAEGTGQRGSGETALAGVPHTAQRWVAVLEQAGLLDAASRPDALHLTPAGRDAVSRYLVAIAGAEPGRGAVRAN